jgi:hypothetical protein
MQNKIYDKVIELFLSRGKQPDPTMVAFWAKKLSVKYAEKYVLMGIERYIWGGDDFPTLAKIAEDIYISARNEYCKLPADNPERTRPLSTIAKYIDRVLSPNKQIKGE